MSEQTAVETREKAQGYTPTPWGRIRDSIVPVEHVGRQLGWSTNRERDRDEYARVIAYACTDSHGREGSPEANAEFIVRACNSYDELLDFLKNWLPIIDDTAAGVAYRGSIFSAMAKDMRALIANAEEQA